MEAENVQVQEPRFDEARIDKRASAWLLTGCLALVGRKIREAMPFFIDLRILDRALYRIMKSGCFPEWFRDQFVWDPVPGALYGLKSLLFQAESDGLFALDRKKWKFRILIGPNKARKLIEEMGLPLNQVRNWVKALDKEIRSGASYLSADKKFRFLGQPVEDSNDLEWDPLL